MAKRKDGRETRSRLLEAASAVFSRKGYRAAKVAEICRLAGANMAAVNYYFGDKESLYVETWRYAFRRYKEPVSSDPVGGSPEERLRLFIRNMMNNFARGGEGRQFSRIYMMELVNPTGLITDDWHELIEPRRQVLREIIMDVMGRDGDSQLVRFCELSIINQCHSLLTVKETDLAYFLGHSLDEDMIQRLADHIADFSLAGIEAVGRQGASSLAGPAP